MGASFTVYESVPEYDTDMSYRAVHICRMELLKMIGLKEAYSTFMSSNISNSEEENDRYWNEAILKPIDEKIQT